MIVWDKNRIYETGIDHCVLYPCRNNDYSSGVAWNGVTSINESDDGYQVTPTYADNSKYLVLISPSNLSISVEAYNYPDEFLPCIGKVETVGGMVLNQQNREMFGLSYRTVIGNDQFSNEYGYKIHLIWGCLAQPGDESYSTVNDSPEALSFSWNIETIPMNFTNHNPISSMTIDSRFLSPYKLEQIEKVLYGDGEIEGRLPSPNEMFSILQLEPLVLKAVNQTERINNISVSEIQDNLLIDSNSISGTVKTLNWLFDPFNFDIDNTVDNHYYLALDLSDNNFDGYTSCLIGVRNDNMIEVYSRDISKILIPIYADYSTLTVTSNAFGQKKVQTFDLSNLNFN